MIETEHNGHHITYSENEDVWRCHALDLDAKTLSALKTKINKIDSESRRVNVEVVYPDRHGFGGKKVMTVLATVIDGDGVWTLFPEGGMRGGRQTKLIRKKLPISCVAENTPETAAAVAKWVAADDEYRKATIREREAFEAIPRLTAARLLELGAKNGEGEP